MASAAVMRLRPVGLLQAAKPGTGSSSTLLFRYVQVV